MPKVSIDHVELYYETNGSGTALLLVPGLGGVGAYWRPQVSVLSQHFQVIVHDHRGTGQSTHDRISYSVEQMAADVLKLMDALGIERAHLVGHSTGGAIGQVIAIEHPERLASVVIYASWTRADPFFTRALTVRKELLLKSGVAAYVQATPLFLYPDWWINANHERLEDEAKQATTSFPPVEIAASRIDGICAFDRHAELGQITTPTLVLCARDDFLTPPYFSQELVRLIPGAQLVLLERGGHACSQTVPDVFNEVVLSFLLAHERGEPWQTPPGAKT